MSQITFTLVVEVDDTDINTSGIQHILNEMEDLINSNSDWFPNGIDVSEYDID